MTTTPLPPLDWVAMLKDAIGIVKGKPTYKRFIDGTPLDNDVPVWMADFAMQHATQARADLEAENANLRLELQSARDINLAVVNRQQAEIEALRKKLAQARQDEADAVRAADAVYEAQERADDAYRAGSSGY